jgi:hypothetical protein
MPFYQTLLGKPNLEDQILRPFMSRNPQNPATVLSNCTRLSLTRGTGSSSMQESFSSLGLNKTQVPSLTLATTMIIEFAIST